jgi:hypothetical protein
LTLPIVIDPSNLQVFLIPPIVSTLMLTFSSSGPPSSRSVESLAIEDGRGKFVVS